MASRGATATITHKITFFYFWSFLKMLLVTQIVLLCLISLTCFLYTLGLTFSLIQNIKIVNLLKCLDWAIFSYTGNIHTLTWHADSVDVCFHFKVHLRQKSCDVLHIKSKFPSSQLEFSSGMPLTQTSSSESQNSPTNPDLTVRVNSSKTVKLTH